MPDSPLTTDGVSPYSRHGSRETFQLYFNGLAVTLATPVAEVIQDEPEQDEAAWAADQAEHELQLQEREYWT
jgi:hypothetical protein